MKFLTVVMFIFMVNIAAATINAIEITAGYKIQPQQDWLDSAETIKDEAYYQSTAAQATSANFGFGDFARGLGLFITTFSLGVIAPSYLFIKLGLDPTLALTLSLPIYLLYGLAIAQMISNRGTKTMD